MKNTKLLLPFLSLLITLSACSYNSGQPTDKEKSFAEAYALQRISVLQHSMKDPVVGFKAGLTSEKSQDAFNTEQPLVGALFYSGLSRDRAAYALHNYKDLRLEVELGFVLRHAITQPITTDQLPQYIKAMLPVVELPNLRFTSKEDMTALTLVTNNVASNQFIIGRAFPFEPARINSLEANLFRNGVEVNHGLATDAMDDQREALVWMINKLLAVGYKLEANHLLITGALGTMLPAQRGQYEARFTLDAEKHNSEKEADAVIAFSIR
ncbi:2-keto-4-pentenoate hydratase [Kangiella sediminilitoris]|uniref:4-oxalocrotonate decarboxylase n=1 Tax=Kangiella sediminilitoris TaxID=1144748 RepID=A0A1B3B7T9_9GAMM|nr:fumarylacetoacetate hydrolase family protein [Kangiella sediminilitoris]AOE48847.1 4-oxalocrotonate decarboxylase [Kangiella sediminilitoris]